MTLPVIAILGRPNVGKSTLFNRILGQPKALMCDIAGTTRDRLYAEVNRDGRSFVLIDTGGIVVGSGDELEQHIERQAMLAFEEADAVLILFDSKTGPTPDDRRLVDLARRKGAGRHIVYAVNKVEGYRDEAVSAEFYELGIDQVTTISGAQGIGVEDLLDELLGALPQVEGPPGLDLAARVAVIGKPNVGKSSLINKILGEERLIVSDIAGTTRDSVDSLVQRGEQTYCFIDTAGIRRKSKVSYTLEKFSVVKSLKSIDQCDVAVLLLDGPGGMADQDLKVASFAHEKGKGLIIGVNKWDVMPGKDQHTADKLLEELREQFVFTPYAPVLFLSAKTGRNLENLFKELDAVLSERKRSIGTPEVNEVLKRAVGTHPPPLTSLKRRLKFNYATQVSSTPPTFLVFCNIPSQVPESYHRYLINTFRDVWGFKGNPIRIVFKDKHKT